MTLEVSDLSYAFGARQALDRVTFRVAQGRFCALLGPNGAGKSTLFNLMTRLFTSPKGRIAIAGHDLARTPRAALARVGTPRLTGSGSGCFVEFAARESAEAALAALPSSLRAWVAAGAARSPLLDALGAEAP